MGVVSLTLRIDFLCFLWRIFKFRFSIHLSRSEAHPSALKSTGDELHDRDFFSRTAQPSCSKSKQQSCSRSKISEGTSKVFDEWATIWIVVKELGRMMCRLFE